MTSKVQKIHDATKRAMRYAAPAPTEIVNCGACQTGELFLYTDDAGDLVTHPTRPNFFKCYCDGCGTVGGVDMTKNPTEFASMKRGKVQPKPVIIVDTRPGVRAAATRRLNRMERE